MTGSEWPSGPRVDRLGEERAPVIVIDNFLNEAQRLFELAAGCSYQPIANHLYPGVRAPAPRGYAEAVVQGVAGLVQQVFGLSEIAGVESDFSLVTTKPAQLKLLQALPHFDTTDTRQLAVLHYLCPPERGGTSFYRHRSTGFESVTAERQEPYMTRLGAELRTAGPPEQAYINGDTNLFQRIGTVDAAFNRLVIYRSVVLHSGDIARDFGFEPDARQGRLTVNTFIHFRRERGPGTIA